MSMRHCKIHEVEMIGAHAQWHKHHVFGQQVMYFIFVATLHRKENSEVVVV